MSNVRVLIVDDSTLFRRILTTVFRGIAGVEVVGSASNGAEAVRLVERLKPDLVSLDLEMPEMDGLETLRRLRLLDTRAKVLMVSAHTTRGARRTIEALCLGAEDFITKQTAQGDASTNLEALRHQLEPKIEQLFPRKSGACAQEIRRQPRNLPPKSAVVIGVSTGGPNALSEVFERLPAGLPVPILIVQHMPPTFTRMLAERLSAKGKVPVSEARDGEPILNGRAYIAPGDFHLEISGDPRAPKVLLSQGPRENSCRPAADVLFRSAARVYGRDCLCVVMTGMGSDGCLGARQIQQAGGEILIQNEPSCVVYGMPRAIAEAAIPHESYALEDLASAITERTLRRPQWRTA
ncbi:MAG: chemotaxis response regulator protein-glutamate methylesterase [Candidatus Eremiobacteraeota bacterium]|nr:chemotaxis response regulator protein-glutamate methylesterase [Candidatus Eremiobacteraeota bacterium]